MPKGGRTQCPSSSERRSRAAPFKRSSSSRQSRPPSSLLRNSPVLSPEKAEVVDEWEEARCPVCMEHPHNAVLLICSSHDMGCRPFMCDTSYRHSYCFSQFLKADTRTLPQTMPSCPLCRGRITHWTVVEPARRYMDAKVRSCSLASCGFSGTYQDLRKHARGEHPNARPSDVDAERQRDWTTMEREQDIRDMQSAVNSAMGADVTIHQVTPATAADDFIYIAELLNIGAPFVLEFPTRRGSNFVMWPFDG